MDADVLLALIVVVILGYLFNKSGPPTYTAMDRFMAGDPDEYNKKDEDNEQEAS